MVTTSMKRTIIRHLGIFRPLMSTIKTPTLTLSTPIITTYVAPPTTEFALTTGTSHQAMVAHIFESLRITMPISPSICDSTPPIVVGEVSTTIQTSSIPVSTLPVESLVVRSE